jgi:hypothetical protein
MRLSRIWPPSIYPIDWRFVAVYDEQVMRSLAEALARELPAGNSELA